MVRIVSFSEEVQVFTNLGDTRDTRYEKPEEELEEKVELYVSKRITKGKEVSFK